MTCKSHFLPSLFSQQFDPAVLGGIAASVLGLGGVAATKAGAGDKTSTAPKSSSTGKSSGIDVSIPYDAAARLAFDAYIESGKEIDFDTFKTKYEAMTIADIKAKNLERTMFPPSTKVDVSIPYDAAARLAYDEWRAANDKGEWGNQAEYEAFKEKYEEMCVAQVTAKKLQKEMA